MKPGADIIIQMFDGRCIEAKVCAVFDTVEGRKVRAVCGSLVVTVNLEQVEVRK
jgi:hypothetical protein